VRKPGGLQSQRCANRIKSQNSQIVMPPSNCVRNGNGCWIRKAMFLGGWSATLPQPRTHLKDSARVAPTSPRQCSWRIPSQCAKPPSPSCHLPSPSNFVDPAEKFPSINCGCSEPIVEFGSHPIRNWNRSNVASLADQINNGPMLFALLKMIQSQRRRFMPPQAAREQQCE
jgi:hypothetical protein